jgi:predicted phage terminase large subunit-like protein
MNVPVSTLPNITPEQIRGLSVDDQRRLYAMQLEKLRKMAPESLEAHAAYIHKTPDNKPIIPAEHHAEWIRILGDPERYPFVVISAPPGYAKALRLTESVLTPSGPTTMRDVQVGDEICNTVGGVSHVTAKSTVMERDTYTLTFWGGIQVVASGDHLWTVQYATSSGSRYRTHTTQELISLLTSGKRVHVRLPQAVEMQDPRTKWTEYIIEPYLLGLFLGDGSMCSENCGVTFGPADVGYAQVLSTHYSGKLTPDQGGVTLEFPGQGLRNSFRALGLWDHRSWEKFVPEDYKHGPLEVRRAVLQGLMDADGGVDNRGVVDYASTSEQLATDVAFLIRSLGGRAKVARRESSYKRDGVRVECRDYYEVSIHGPNKRDFFRLQRKIDRCPIGDPGGQGNLLLIESIEPTGLVEEVQCITTDAPDHLFLTNDFVPTHNSTWITHIYPTWEIGRTKGRIRVGIISNTATQSSSWGGAIMGSIQTERFQLAYPTVKPDEGRGWGRGDFYVKGAPEGANPTVFTAGIGGPILGKRFDLIILDDPTTWDQARSDVVMEGQKHWLRTTLVTRLPPERQPPEGIGRMVVILTRWGENDLVPELKKLGFIHINMPAIGYWDRKLECGDCGAVAQGRELEIDDHDIEKHPTDIKRRFSITVHPVQRRQLLNETVEVTNGEMPLWPKQHPIEKLIEAKKNDELIFELVMQGNPKVLSGDVFKSEWFQYGDMPPRAEFSKVIQYVDTAGGKDRRRGDFFALATVGMIKYPATQDVPEHERVWIMDMIRERIPAPEQERRVRWAAEYWNPDAVIIEDMNEGISLLQILQSGSGLPVKGYRPTRDKEFRTIPLSNGYRTKRVWHPKDAGWVTKYEMELLSFPAGPNDDQVDAASGAYEHLSTSQPRLWTLTG